MNVNDKLITLAKKYCRDNYVYWRDKYEKERTGNDFPYKYTDNDYDLFPRYLMINAISNGIDFLVGRKHKTYGGCVQSLLNAVDYSDDFTSNPTNEIQKAAMDDEKQKYLEYILSFNENSLEDKEVTRSPYRRRLGKQESEKIRKLISEKWEYTDCWYPISTVVIPTDVLFLMEKYVLPYEKNIVNIIKGISLEKYYSIDETGADYKQSIKEFNLSLLYQGSETFCCDASFEWVVYGSHESTISFGGDKLVYEVKKLHKGFESKFNIFESP